MSFAARYSSGQGIHRTCGISAFEMIICEDGCECVSGRTQISIANFRTFSSDFQDIQSISTVIASRLDHVHAGGELLCGGSCIDGQLEDAIAHHLEVRFEFASTCYQRGHADLEVTSRLNRINAEFDRDRCTSESYHSSQLPHSCTGLGCSLHQGSGANGARLAEGSQSKNHILNARAEIASHTFDDFTRIILCSKDDTHA